MISVENETYFSLDLDFLEKITLSLTDKEIELMVVEDEDMHQINLEQRGVDKSTDVLSFPVEPFPHAPLGTIIINTQKVFEASKEFSHSDFEEFCILFIHGVLHLLGYDHEVDEGQMRAKEEELIKEFNLPKSLIVRS